MNRLAASSSPYLRQHRDNPVDWHEWGDEAFALARTTDRPVLLSVGYSACHWCHVMAHESFSDVEVAEAMNAGFVCVKVDREERPDVDAIYMDAVQALTGRGGWPLTVFLTPGGEPFFGGTYYPRDRFLDLLGAVGTAWHTRRADLDTNVKALLGAVNASGTLEPSAGYDAEGLVESCTAGLVTAFDPVWGGFAGPPKFPSPMALTALLCRHIASGDGSLRPVIVTTLDAMACGGIYDHIGGGFARYSVDERWLVPHFEKMLYDQALLARAYFRAWKTFGHARHHQVASETIDWVLADLRHPAGGFFSSTDADSQGPSGHPEEGAFFTWTPAEVRDVIGERAVEACAYWAITDAGNFDGRSIPNRIHARPDLARPDAIERFRRVLAEARAQRPPPGLDDKVLTEWNAMFLATLAEAALLSGNDRWRTAAVANGAFLLDNLRNDEGRWMRCWHADASPRARHPALAHDLAHLVDAFSRLYELTGNATWLGAACDVADRLLEDHWDTAAGGLYTTAHGAERLVVRQKDIVDNATPSANSAATVAFLRLSALTGRRDLAGRARDILRLLCGPAGRSPTAFTNAAVAWETELHGIDEVVVPGVQPAMVSEYAKAWRPFAVLAQGEPIDGPLWTGRQAGFAYVCRDSVCELPAATPADLALRLR